jgi:alpha/beta hydrolase fold
MRTSIFQDSLHNRPHSIANSPVLHSHFSGLPTKKEIQISQNHKTNKKSKYLPTHTHGEREMVKAGMSFSRLFSHLRRLLHCVSIVYFHDLFVTLFFIYNHLIPLTINLVSTGPIADFTSIHIWAPLVHRRSKPTLVLIHGFGGDAKWQFRNQIGALSRSFNLYIPDLIFFGNSRSDSPNRSVHFQAQCIAQAMKQLRLERYNIAGISYGGFVAYRMGLDVAREEVEKIVVLTSGVCASDERRRELVQREGRDVREILCPQKPEDLRLLVRRSMHRPPVWMPDFYLRDFIEVCIATRSLYVITCTIHCWALGTGVFP